MIGLPDPEAGELPIAFIVASDPAPTEDEIKAFLDESLAHYKQVHRIDFVSEIPKSLMAKSRTENVIGSSSRLAAV